MTKVPCKDCGKREARCHVDCGEYRAWNEEHVQMRENARKVRAADKDIKEYCMKNVERYKKNLID